MKKHENNKFLARLAVVGVLFLAMLASYWWLSRHPDSKPLPTVKVSPPISVQDPKGGSDTPEANDTPAADGEAEPADEEEEDGDNGETREEREARLLVDAFDNTVDIWRETVPGGATLAKINEFAQMFKGLPENSKDDCLHRALNLIPDENFEILLGILVDKSAGDDYVQMIFDDMINRDETLKKALLLEIFKDKNHPCWSQAAMILDATGELENAGTDEKKQ